MEYRDSENLVLFAHAAHRASCLLGSPPPDAALEQTLDARREYRNTVCGHSPVVEKNPARLKPGPGELREPEHG